MPGILYIVATPIGNLKDITLRAIETLQEADFIAAEDTRVTLKLLNHLNIKKPMISYYEHNEHESAQKILSRLNNGEDCALCSDAGTPAISDPGEWIVTKALQQGIRVIPIPGASASVTALCASGQKTGQFIFEGFLPQNKKQRKSHLKLLLNEQRTIIIYEAPHKLKSTLQDLVEYFGNERSVTICRELTKKYEEINKMTLENAIIKYNSETPRGEFVLILQGKEPEPEDAENNLEKAVELAHHLIKNEGASVSYAAREAAHITGVSRSVIYKKLI